MQVFIGSPALSTFRLKKYLSTVQQLVPTVTHINAHYVHFVDSETVLSVADEAIIDKLLRYGPELEDVSSEGKLILVTPRVGTISPWSSKATDIAHNCNLTLVRRIERGIAYNVSCESDYVLSETDTTTISATLHDRMTEMVMFDYAEAACLFEHHQPLAGESIDVIQGGGRH